MTLPLPVPGILRLFALAALVLLPLSQQAVARPGTAAAFRPAGRGTDMPAPATAIERGTPLALATPRAFLPPTAAPMVQANRPSFVTGITAGLAGAGLVAMLAGRPPLSGLDGSFAGFLGLGTQLLLVLVLAFGLYQLLRRLPRLSLPHLSSPLAHGFVAGSPGFSGQLSPRFAPRGGGAPAAPSAPALTAVDFRAFETSLKEVKAAWSRQDVPGLQGLCTAEMVQHYADQLARLASRSLRNRMTDVTLEQGDLAETWVEGNRQFATVAMRFSLVDCTRDERTKKVMGGDPVRRTHATEVWTFVRPRGGSWTLTAVQGVH